MDSHSFVESFRSISSSYLKLIDSLSALRTLSTIETECYSDEALLKRALSVLMENQDLERCSIYLLEGDKLINVAGLDWQQLISLGRSSEVPTPTHPCTSFLLGEGVVGLAAQSGQILHCHDCEQDPEFLPRDVAPGTVVGSIVSVPIVHGTKILGVLNVSHPHAHFFDDGHERSLRIYSNVLGQLLINNRLIHQMDEMVRQRTQQLQIALEEAEILRSRFETLSSIDDLTQLHNRRFFFPESRAALARAIRRQQAFSVVLIDVDHFKVVNDTYGHATGDIVLHRIAQVLREQLREGDILARFGGEEFILALPDTSSTGAMILAERIRELIKTESWQIDKSTLQVTVTIGVSDVSEYFVRDSQKLLEKLIMEADRALYHGKHHGRDQCRDFNLLSYR